MGPFKIMHNGSYVTGYLNMLRFLLIVRNLAGVENGVQESL